MENRWGTSILNSLKVYTNFLQLLLNLLNLIELLNFFVDTENNVLRLA